MRCEFSQVAERDGRYQYQCQNCGRLTGFVPNSDPARVHARCGTQTSPPIDCRARSADPVETVPGDVLDCKCGGVVLYECREFSELVLLQTIRSEHDHLIQANRSRYRGRCCQGCGAFAGASLPLLAAESG